MASKESLGDSVKNTIEEAMEIFEKPESLKEIQERYGKKMMEHLEKEILGNVGTNCSPVVPENFGASILQPVYKGHEENSPKVDQSHSAELLGSFEMMCPDYGDIMNRKPSEKDGEELQRRYGDRDGDILGDGDDKVVSVTVDGFSFSVHKAVADAVKDFLATNPEEVMKLKHEIAARNRSFLEMLSLPPVVDSIKANEVIDAQEALATCDNFLEIDHPQGEDTGRGWGISPYREPTSERSQVESDVQEVEQPIIVEGTSDE